MVIAFYFGASAFIEVSNQNADTVSPHLDADAPTTVGGAGRAASPEDAQPSICLRASTGRSPSASGALSVAGLVLEGDFDLRTVALNGPVLELHI